jgi:hypothetical protein
LRGRAPRPEINQAGEQHARIEENFYGHRVSLVFYQCSDINDRPCL